MSGAVSWRAGLALVVLVTVWVAAYAIVPVPTTPYILSERLRLGGVERDWVPIDDISENLQRAVVAAEDANFCLHWGFDMAAIRAAIDAGAARGGSTISQQTVKNAFLWHGRSWLRKALEAAITPLMEALWPKRRILEVYLNVAEFDEGVFGAEAAARIISASSGVRPQRRTGRAAGRRPARAAGSVRAAAQRLRARPRRVDPRRRGDDPRRRSGRVLHELNFDASFGIKSCSNRSKRDFMTRLYHFALSPFCRKVRLVLAEKKIDVELVDEKYWEPSTEFLRRNPAGKVPILKIDGLTLTESGAICEYVEETRPDPPLMPTDPAPAPRCGASCRGSTTSSTTRSRRTSSTSA
jgi:monofunctional biosynthetic peptidoglycan transglycosylase